MLGQQAAEVIQPETAQRGPLIRIRERMTSAMFAVQDVAEAAGRALLGWLSSVSIWLESLRVWLWHGLLRAWQAVADKLSYAWCALSSAASRFYLWVRGVWAASGLPGWMGKGGAVATITLPIVFRKVIFTGLKYGFRQLLKRVFRRKG
jgi:hypothetical protein